MTDCQASPSSIVATTAFLERTLDISLCLTLGYCLPLVVLPLAPRQRDLHLRQPILDVQSRRDDRVPSLRHPRNQPIYLAPVQQEFPLSAGLVLPDLPSRLVGSYVDIGQPQLPVLGSHVSVTETDSTGPN
jgi:hypothetical protein